MKEGQRTRILERLQQGGKVPMPELSAIGSGNPNGWCSSFSRRISELREMGHVVICHKSTHDGQVRTSYELVK